MSSVEWEDLTDHDRPMCFRFGSGAFPCGPAVKVRVTKTSRVFGGSAKTTVTRRTVCQMHYDQAVAKTPNASSVKAKAITTAQVRLAAIHADEFQRLYVSALSELGFNADGTATQQ